MSLATREWSYEIPWCYSFRNFYALAFLNAFPQNNLCCFSFSWLKVYHHPKVQPKGKSNPMITQYVLQRKILRHLTHSDRSLTEKNCHKWMLHLLPWFLFNFLPKLISNNLYIKEVSEQHMESECLLQQPEEEDHWIQSWNKENKNLSLGFLCLTGSNCYIPYLSSQEPRPLWPKGKG